MIRCPACARVVDETTTGSCPTCGQALQLAVFDPLRSPGQTAADPAQAAYAGPSVRRTLSGEIIESPSAQPAAPPPLTAANAAPSRAPVIPRSPAGQAAPTAYRAARPASARESPRTAGIVAVVISLLFLLGLCAAGGWWFLSHRGPGPKEQADRFFTAVKALDYRTLYDVTEVDKTKYPTADEFVRVQEQQVARARQLPVVGAILDSLKTISVTTSKPEIAGTNAYVPYHLTMAFQGRTISQDGRMHLVENAGVWRVSQQQNDAFMSGFAKGEGGH